MGNNQAHPMTMPSYDWAGLRPVIEIAQVQFTTGNGDGEFSKEINKKFGKHIVEKLQHGRYDIQFSDRHAQESEDICRNFADEHGIEYRLGEVGFGQPCVGYLVTEDEKRGSYIDYNPVNQVGQHYFPFNECLEPINITDAYHKHDCMCVLLRDDLADKALEVAVCQLANWVIQYDMIGVVVMEFASDVPSSGGVGHCFIRKDDGV